MHQMDMWNPAFETWENRALTNIENCPIVLGRGSMIEGKTVFAKKPQICPPISPIHFHLHPWWKLAQESLSSLGGAIWAMMPSTIHFCLKSNMKLRLHESCSARHNIEDGLKFTFLLRAFVKLGAGLVKGLWKGLCAWRCSHLDSVDVAQYRTCSFPRKFEGHHPQTSWRWLWNLVPACKFGIC